MSAYLGSTPVNVLNLLFRNEKARALYLGSTQVWSDWSPLDLFAGGKQGAWYDPSDKSTLFQDVVGTVPVTKDGDPVALMKDKSGNSKHATQTVSTSRPIYKGLRYDGVDDFMNVNLPMGSSDFTLSIAVDTTGVLEGRGNLLGTASPSYRDYATLLSVSSGVRFVALGAEMVGSTTSIANTGVRVITVMRSGLKYSLFIDGLLKDTRTQTTVANIKNIELLGKWATTAVYGGQSIGGMLLINAALSAEQRESVEIGLLGSYKL